MGGGGYDRSASLTQFDPGDAGYRAIVGSFPDLAGAIPSWTSFDDLPAAVAGWNDWAIGRPTPRASSCCPASSR